MALSLLQEAQTARGLAAVRAMAGMKHDDERALSISPPINNNNNNTLYNNNNLNNNNNDTSHLMYPGGFNTAAAAASAMGMSQLIAANQRAAAIMAAGLPMSLRATLASATGLFPHYPGLFAAWAPQQQQQQQQNSKSPSPTSPISPVLSTKSSKKLNNNNHIVSTTTGDLPVVQKKANKRKQISVKKDLMSPKLMTQSVEIPVSVDMISQGPISPPTSGSSPQSNGSIDQVPPVHSTPGKDPCRDKVFTCKICNRSFGYKHVLQNHERTHTGEKPFECPECHKRFTRDHHLKTHMRLHTGEKPYHCSHCDRHFVQVANLRRHLRVHTGERPYTCEICQAKFSDSNQLKAHMLMHNGEKPFRCDRCHTNFRRRHHLMHHKCGITSPPTPAMSPVMSLSDQKSASSRSEVSDESIEIKPTSLHHYPATPLPLGIAETDVADPVEKRNRKSRDIRRVIRMAPQIIHVPTDLPEQTEPEDLSMHSPRSPASLVSMHDEDLDDLDDAASLYMKQRITKLHLPHSMES